MPSIDKADRRDERRRKSAMRSSRACAIAPSERGELVSFEALRKTKIEGKTVKRRKNKK